MCVRGPQRAIDPLELELQIAQHHHAGLGIQPRKNTQSSPQSLLPFPLKFSQSPPTYNYLGPTI